MRIKKLNPSNLKTALVELAKADSDLIPLTELDIDLMPPRSRPDGFAGLVQIIVEQQVSVAAGASMTRSLQKGVGEFTPKNFLRYEVEELRQYSLSQQKATYCLNLSRQVDSGKLDIDALPKLPDEEVRNQLMQVKGIGRWSADIYLLGHLQRADVIASGDLALQVAVQHIKNLPQRPDSREVDRIAEQWAPWRSVASLLLWQCYRNLKAKP